MLSLTKYGDHAEYLLIAQYKDFIIEEPIHTIKVIIKEYWKRRM